VGLLSWLFPSPQDRLDKARNLLESGEYAQALNHLEGLELDEVPALLGQAREGLQQLNLKMAVAHASAHEFERAEEHLELALGFSGSGNEAIHEARRVVRDLRSSAPEEKEARRAPAANGPLGMGGAGPQVVAGEAGIAEAEGQDDLWSLPPDDPRLRFALTLETYPEDLRERMVQLGAGFAEAVALTDEGQAAKAVEKLGKFVAADPVARYERARAAQSAGKLGMAGSDLATFRDAVGHQKIGNLHTGAMLAQVLAAQDRLDDALEAAESALADDPKEIQLLGTRASLLEGLGRIEEADDAARNLVKQAPSDMGLYRLMARCRIQGNKPVEAMQVLESGLRTNCSGGGCGTQAFDVEAGRMLARLYLENRMEPKRADDLVNSIHQNIKAPTWFEDYLDALTARNEEAEDALEQARSLLPAANDTDNPRRKILLMAFPDLQPQASV
jgi:tetratricopeptide (TPR) repeat protein